MYCDTLIGMSMKRDVRNFKLLKKICIKKYTNSQSMEELFRSLAREVSRSKSFNEDRAGRERCATLDKLPSAIRRNSIDRKTFWHIVD